MTDLLHDQSHCEAVKDPEVSATISQMLARVGDKWSMLMIRTLGHGPAAVQRAATPDRRHQPEGPLEHVEGARARRAGLADGRSERAATGELRAHRPRPRTADPGDRHHRLDDRQHRPHRRRPAGLRRRGRPNAMSFLATVSRANSSRSNSGPSR